ncbi:MAG: pilus assembly protein [Elusimicrobiota bacterium]|jgi:Flp pilus assembly protein TadG|nr:pilus assembly protein [Elusimicrobiota bacterium]
MKKNFLTKSSKGQAFTEAALFSPLIIFFLFTIFWFGRVMLTHQQLTGAARYGSDLIANTPFTKSYIETSVKNYLTDKSIVGRIIDPTALTVKVEINDFPKFDTTISIANIGSILSILGGIVDIGKQATPLRSVSYVEVSYKYKFPSVLKITGKDSFDLKVRSEVLSGTGAPATKKRT